MSDRLTEIEARLDDATPGPWNVVNIIDMDADGTYELAHVTAPDPFEPDTTVQGVALGIHRPDAKFIAEAPTDIRALLNAVNAVLSLAKDWDARGEHDMAYSKTIPDEDIAMELLTNGADMVENARHIRNAINEALKGK
jgi:hypothetical protein